VSLNKICEMYLVRALLTEAGAERLVLTRA
jgi:hypothetical protein